MAALVVNGWLDVVVSTRHRVFGSVTPLADREVVLGLVSVLEKMVRLFSGLASSAFLGAVGAVIPSGRDGPSGVP